MWLVFYIVVFLPQIILHILFNKEIGSWAWKLNARHREREKLSPSGPRWSFSQLRGGFPLAVLCRRRRGRGSTCKSRSRQQTGTLHAHWLTAQWASDECSTLPGTVLLTGDEAVPQKDQEGKNLHLKECACSDFLSCLCGGTGTARGAGCAAGSWAKFAHSQSTPPRGPGEGHFWESGITLWLQGGGSREKSRNLCEVTACSGSQDSGGYVLTHHAVDTRHPSVTEHLYA